MQQLCQLRQLFTNMREKDHYLCKYADTCKYGVMVGSWSICDYIGMTGTSRIHNDPAGEIIDGRCGHYEEAADERTSSGAKDRIKYKSEKRHVL